MVETAERMQIMKVAAVECVNIILIGCVFQFVIPHLPGVSYSGNILEAFGFACLSQISCVIFAVISALIFTINGAATAAFGSGNPVLELGKSAMQYTNFASKHQLLLLLLAPILPKMITLKLLDIYCHGTLQLAHWGALISATLAVHAIAVVMYFVNKPPADREAEV